MNWQQTIEDSVKSSYCGYEITHEDSDELELVLGDGLGFETLKEIMATATAHNLTLNIMGASDHDLTLSVKRRK